MNQGAGQVTTPFFVQVDADMVLDPNCLETLRAAVREDTGVAVAELRDPLVGQRTGIKLFRTECLRQEAFPDRISPDTDFIAAIRRRGWQLHWVGPRPDGSAPRMTIGEHRPDYTPGYTYRKYLLEGRRLRYRSNPGGMRWSIGVLETSLHPMARLAQLATTHGFFRPEERDMLTRDFAEEERQAGSLVEWFEQEVRVDRLDLPSLDRKPRLRDVFSSFFAAGRVVQSRRAGATLRAVWDSLAGAGRDWYRFVAKLGFGHGALSETTPPSPLEESQAVERFLSMPGRW